MLIDKRTERKNSYRYSVVYYENAPTAERYNLGVLMQDGDMFMTHLPTLPRSVFNCLDMGQSLSGVNFSLSLIHERMDKYGMIHAGDVSNTVKISEPVEYETKMDAQQSLHHLVQKLVSIKKLRELPEGARKVSYGKIQIIKGLREIKRREKEDNLHFHQHMPGMANIVDAAYKKDDIIVSVAQVNSPHTKNFYKDISASIVMLGEYSKIDTIKDRFIYAPIVGEIGKTDRMKFDQLTEYAEANQIDIIRQRQHEAVVERLIAASA